MQILCALLLCLSYLTPQPSPSEPFDCVVVEVKDSQAVTVCDQGDQAPECSPLHNEKACVWRGMVIPLEKWPSAWPKAEKGALFRAQRVNGGFQPVTAERSGPLSKFIKEVLARVKNADSVAVKCVLVNLSPLRMACDDKSEFVIPEGEWPEVWHSQHLTGTYNAELRDGQMYAVETVEEPGRNDRIRANTLKEMRRWRIPPTQTSGRPE